MDVEWIFFAASSHGKAPSEWCWGICCYVAKHSLQRPLHDHIWSYLSMFNLGVSQEEMVDVHAVGLLCKVKDLARNKE